MKHSANIGDAVRRFVPHFDKIFCQVSSSGTIYRFISNIPPRIFFSHSLLVFLRSRTSARIGKRNEPPGRTKIATAGMIFAMFLRCLFTSFFSSLVHFSSVLRVFIRSCISPFIERTSIRMASLLIMISLLRYFLIIYFPFCLCQRLARSFVLSRGFVESSEKLLYALLITQISKEDYTDFSYFSVGFRICLIGL